MDKTTIRIHKKIRAKKPVLVLGLPGIGLVGKIAVDYLAKEKKAEKIATIYSPFFPPQVIMRKNGILRMLRMKLYYSKQKKNDILILTGDVQAATPDAHFEICGKIIDYFKSMGGKRIYTVAGYGIGKTTDHPKVYGAATHKKLIPKFEKMGIEFGKTKGSIVGAAGLMLGLGRLKGLDGICIMGETHGGYIDPKSALIVTKMLSKVLDVKISTKELEKKVKLGEAFVKKMEAKAAKTQGVQARAGSVDELSYIR